MLKKGANSAQVRALLVQVARDTPGVVDVGSFVASLDSATRRLTVTMQFSALVDGVLVYEPFVVDVEV